MRDTEQRICMGFFWKEGLFWNNENIPNQYKQLLYNMTTTCSADSPEWKNASEEKEIELLIQYAGCVEPFFNQFKTQHNCN